MRNNDIKNVNLTEEFKNINYEIVNAESTEGIFERDDGQKIPYRTVRIWLRIEGYPMTFSFKLDRGYSAGPYLTEAIKEGLKEAGFNKDEDDDEENND